MEQNDSHTELRSLFGTVHQCLSHTNTSQEIPFRLSAHGFPPIRNARKIGRGTYHGLLQNYGHTENRSCFSITAGAQVLGLHVMAGVNWGTGQMRIRSDEIAGIRLGQERVEDGAKVESRV